MHDLINKFLERRGIEVPRKYYGIYNPGESLFPIHRIEGIEGAWLVKQNTLMPIHVTMDYNVDEKTVVVTGTWTPDKGFIIDK